MTARGGFIGILDVADASPNVLQIDGGVLQGLRVGDDHLGLFLQQSPGDEKGRALPCVARVGLEGEAQQADLFGGQRVEHGFEHRHRETVLLVFVDFDDALPVIGHLVETIAAAQIDEVQDVLFEAGTAEADAGIEKLCADAAVHPDGPGDLADIGLGLFAEGGDGVDRRDPLGKKGIGDELGKLAAPDV